MKADFHFHFYSRLGIIAVLLFALFFVSQSIKTPVMTKAVIDNADITYWAWSNSVGWVSLNCNNDFDSDGVPENNTCFDPITGTGLDYGLKIVNAGDPPTPHIQGCAWAGTPLNSGEQCSDTGIYCTDDLDCPTGTCEPISLGWICFSNPPGASTNAPINGIPTSSDYLNALHFDVINPNLSSFASILSLETYFCTGGDNNGSPCSPSDASDCPFGICEAVAGDYAWSLGFPIQDPFDSSYVRAGNPINGCFNCYEEYIYHCSISGASCAGPLAICNPTGDPPQSQTCVVTDTNYNCDNCLEYSYFDWPASKCSETGDYCTKGNQDICDAEDPPNDLCLFDPLYVKWYRCEGTGTNCTVGDQSICGDIATGNICVDYDIGDLERVIGAYECSECTIENYDNTCGNNAYQTNLNSCNACVSVFGTPGLMIDTKHNNLQGDYAHLCGWAWNAWQGGAYSLGWFQFAPKVDTSTQPYISTGGGNIYSKGNIFGKYFPPYGYANASFLIESGGSITNFVSSSTLEEIYQGEMPKRPAIDFLSYVPSIGKYQNALGTIDYLGLITPVYGNYNKYDSEIVKPTTIDAFRTQFLNPGEGKVIYWDGNLSTGGPINAFAGETKTQRGSMTIVVDGNLTIEGNIGSQTGVIENLKQLASLVWVVKGDVYVKPIVEDVVSTFVVLGDGVNSCTGERYTCFSDFSSLADAGCGQFISCAGGDSVACKNGSHLVPMPFNVHGNVIAHQFELCRTYYDKDKPFPAEYFINDGRLQVNPPPGFSDFSKVVPRFSETPN